MDLNEGISGIFRKEEKLKDADKIGQEVSDIHYYGFRLADPLVRRNHD